MRRRSTLATGLGLALAVGVAAPAVAAPIPSPVLDVEVGQSVTVEGSLFGEVVVVPGFRDTRNVTIRNDGELDGNLTVAVVNAETRQDPEGGTFDGFFDDLTVNRIAASSLAGQASTPLHEGMLAAGESVTVPVALEFFGSTGNRAVVDEQVFSFDVRATLTGEFPAQEGDDEDRSTDNDEGSGTGRDDTTPPTTERQVGERKPSGPVADTGGILAGTNPWLLFGAAALVGAAIGIVPLTRRKSESSD